MGFIDFKGVELNVFEDSKFLIEDRMCAIQNQMH